MAEEKKTNALVYTKKVVTASGALDLDFATQEFQTGGAIANTLADGEDGQRMRLIMTVDGGNAVVTPASVVGATATITFADVGDCVDLEFCSGQGWAIVQNFGATLA